MSRHTPSPRFSLVIPAHNEEQFLDECLSSIKGQSFQDVDVLLVADSCSDRTAEITRSYGYEPIEVSCGKAGLARNAGLERATGEYLLFLDADDYYLTSDALRVLDSELTRRPTDILCFGFMLGARLAKTLLPSGAVWANVWSKAFRREVVTDLRFTDLTTAEDMEWLNKALGRSSKTTMLDVPLIQYRYPRVGSLTDQANAGAIAWETDVARGGVRA